jgi:hypothetical protein
MADKELWRQKYIASIKQEKEEVLEETFANLNTTTFA